MRSLAHQAIDAGATLVVGSHPHWVQATEWYKGMPILYSLGNFVFDQDWSIETKQGMFTEIVLRNQKPPASGSSRCRSRISTSHASWSQAKACKSSSGSLTRPTRSRRWVKSAPHSPSPSPVSRRGGAAAGGGGEGLTRRRLVTGGAALTLAALTPWLGGCGRSAPATTLRVQLRLDPYEQSFFARTILPPFARAQRVDVQFVSGTIDETLDALRNGSERCDLLAVDTEAVGGLIAEGLAQDVSAEQARIDGAIFASIPASVTSGGKLYALPYRPAVWITYVNTALLAAANVRQPPTWDDLLAIAGQLHGGNGDGLVALQGAAGGPAAQTLLELIWAFGGNPLAPVDAGALAAGEYLARLGPRLAPLSRDGKIDSLTTALGADRAALGPNWPAVAEDLLQRGGKRAIATYAGPAGPAGLARLISGQVLLAPRNAPNPQAALALAAHLRSLDVQRACAANLAWIPARDDAFGAAPAWQRSVAAAARQALHAARAVAPVRDRAAFDAALSDACRAIAFDGQPPQGALAQATERLRGLQ